MTEIEIYESMKESAVNLMVEAFKNKVDPEIRKHIIQFFIALDEKREEMIQEKDESIYYHKEGEI